MTVAADHIAKFNESIAYLFYAVAAIDGKVRIEEKREIKALVDQYWTSESEGINSRDIIFSTLRKVISSGLNAEVVFQNFKKYFHLHPEQFDEKIKKKIMDAANGITMAFHGRNKSESVLLGHLYFLLYD